MLEVVFRARAEADLREIQEWYGAVAPESVERILDDIYRAIDRLREQPYSAPKVHRRNWRRKNTRRYRF